MFFEFDEYSRPLWIYTTYIVAYLLVFLMGLKYVLSGSLYKDRSNVRPMAFIVFFTIFAVFYCLGSDYFRYRSLVSLAFDRGYLYSRQEQLYQDLAFYVQGNYELFRSIVWGSAIVLTAFSCKILKVPVFVSLLFWFILFYDKVCYARASLAMAILYAGAAVIIRAGNKPILIALGLGICFASLYFHRSMVIALIGVPILFLNKLNRKSLFLYGLFLIIGTLYFIYIINSAPDLLSEEYGSKLEDYNAEIESGRWERTSLKNYLSSAIGYGLFYVPIGIAFSKINKRGEDISPHVVKLYWFAFTIAIVATAFWFYYGFNNAYFYRVLYMTAAPISITLAHLYHRGIVSGNIIVLLMSYSVVFHLLLLYTLITTQHIS